MNYKTGSLVAYSYTSLDKKKKLLTYQRQEVSYKRLTCTMIKVRKRQCLLRCYRQNIFRQRTTTTNGKIETLSKDLRLMIQFLIDSSVKTIYIGLRRGVLYMVKHKSCHTIVTVRGSLQVQG